MSPTAASRPCALRRAFTLVELLVVIGIIALLIAILLPVLGKAQEQARSAACLSNLRQIGIALNAYANDASGYLVPKDYSVNGASGSNHDVWAVLLVDGNYLQAPSQDVNSPNSVGSSVFRCPSGLNEMNNADPADTAWGKKPGTIDDAIGAMFWRQTSTTTGKTIDIWYGVNGANYGAWFGYFPFFLVPGDAGTNPSRCHRLTEFKDPSSLALVFDGVAYHHGDRYGQNFINGRHNRGTRTNVLMADAHAESLPRDSLPNVNYELKPPAGSIKTAHPYPRWYIVP